MNDPYSPDFAIDHVFIFVRAIKPNDALTNNAALLGAVKAAAEQLSATTSAVFVKDGDGEPLWITDGPHRNSYELEVHDIDHEAAVRRILDMNGLHYWRVWRPDPYPDPCVACRKHDLSVRCATDACGCDCHPPKPCMKCQKDKRGVHCIQRPCRCDCHAPTPCLDCRKDERGFSCVQPGACDCDCHRPPVPIAVEAALSAAETSVADAPPGEPAAG